MIYQTTLNMKKIIITLLSITMLLNATNAFAWGAKGHDVVAAIAVSNAKSDDIADEEPSWKS